MQQNDITVDESSGLREPAGILLCMQSGVELLKLEFGH